MPTVPYANFPFTSGGTYQALSPVIAADRAINWFPEKVPEPGAKAPIALIPRPGLNVFASVGTGPIRALWAGNDRLFCVSGANFLEIDVNTGAIFQNYGVMAGSSGTGPCQIVANGSQLLVMDSSCAKIFWANTGAFTMDPVFDGFSLEYLDTFYYALSATTENRVNQSNSLDGTTWNPLNFADITGTVDLKTRLIVVNGYLWILGQNNTEVWFNAGNSGFSLERMGNGTLNVGIQGGYGITAAFSAVRVRNTLLWMGADERGFGKFWRADGLTPVQISTPGIEALLLTYGNILNPRSFAEEYDGHIFYVTNFPNANGGLGATLVYDLTTGMWHERTYNNLGTQERARPDCFASLQGTAFSFPKNFVGDYATNKIYIQSYSYSQDNGVNIIYTRTSPHLSNSNRWVKHQSLMLDGTFGSATPTLAYSDDGGSTFGSAADMQVVGTSAAEGVTTFQSWQLGRSRDRVYKVVIDTNQQVRVSNAWLSVEAGTEP